MCLLVLLVYLLINWSVAGDPFCFPANTKDVIRTVIRLTVGGNSPGNLGSYPTAHEAEMVGTQELFFVALGFVCTSLAGSSCARFMPCG